MDLVRLAEIAISPILGKGLAEFEVALIAWQRIFGRVQVTTKGPQEISSCWQAAEAVFAGESS